MVNKVGSGRASGPDAQRASSEASRGALDGLRGAAPSFGFVFASPSLSLSECLRAVAKVAGGAKLVGRYARRREADRRAGIVVTDSLVRLFSNDRAWLGAARGAGLAALDLLPPARRLPT